MSDESEGTGGKPANVHSGERSAVRWLGIGLMLSLAINAFIVGVVATKAIKFRDLRRPGPPPLVDALGDSRRMISAVPKERRKELRRIVRTHNPQLKPHREALAAARDKLIAVLRVEPTDQSKLAEALQTIQEARFAMRETGRDVLTDVVAAMTASERKQLADRLARSKRKKKKKKVKKKDVGTSS